MDYLSHFSIGAHQTCFSSQHGKIDCLLALSFHGVYTCWSCEPLHSVAKLCEVLKYHLRQKLEILAEKAKNSKNIKLQELKNVMLSTGSQRGRRGVVGWLYQRTFSKPSPQRLGVASGLRRMAHHIDWLRECLFLLLLLERRWMEA